MNLDDPYDPYHGCCPYPLPTDNIYSQADFVAAIAAERERCARVCEDVGDNISEASVGRFIARRIRDVSRSS